MLAIDYYRAALWAAAGSVVMVLLAAVAVVWWAYVFAKRPSDKIGEE